MKSKMISYSLQELTLYKIKLMPDHDQYELVFTKEDFITSPAEGSSRFFLNALYRFFVEIEYDIALNRILEKRSFITGELLNKYADLNF